MGYVTFGETVGSNILDALPDNAPGLVAVGWFFNPPCTLDLDAPCRRSAV